MGRTYTLKEKCNISNDVITKFNEYMYVNLVKENTDK